MMTGEIYNTEQKEIYFKAYQHLTGLENDLKLLKEKTASVVHISIVGQFSQFYHDRNIEFSKDPDPIKVYWRKTLDNRIAFGDFYNHEIGNIFVVGTLVSIFLHKAGSQTLGTLSVGPYGILRGIGATEAQATSYLNLLTSGSYLLIIRAFVDEIEQFKQVLEQEVNE